MKEHKLYEYIRVFSPKKGIRGFFGLPFIVYGIFFLIVLLPMCAAGGAVFQGVIETVSPALAVTLDIVFEMVNTSGISSKKSKRLMLLRSAPNMKSVMKKAFICDEIRRIILLIFAYALSFILLCINGHALQISFLGCAAALFGVYAFSSFAVYIIRRAPLGSASLIVVYFTMITAAVLIEMLFMYILLEAEFIFGIAAVITAAAAAVITAQFTLRFEYKQAVNCYYE